MNIKPQDGPQEVEQSETSVWRTWGASLVAVSAVFLIMAAAISLAFQDIGSTTSPSTPVAAISTSEGVNTSTPTQVSPPTATNTPRKTSTPTPTLSPSPSATTTPTATLTVTPTNSPSPAAEAAIICYYPTTWGDPSTWVQYTVKAKDSLFSIAEHAQVPLWTLVSTNCFTEGTGLAPGQVIWLPLLGKPSPTWTPAPTPSRMPEWVAPSYATPFVTPQPVAPYPWSSPVPYIPAPTTPYWPEPTYPPPAPATQIPPAPTYAAPTMGAITVIPVTPQPFTVPEYTPRPVVPPPAPMPTPQPSPRRIGPIPGI